MTPSKFSKFTFSIAILFAWTAIPAYCTTRGGGSHGVVAGSAGVAVEAFTEVSAEVPDGRRRPRGKLRSGPFIASAYGGRLFALDAHVPSHSGPGHR